MSKHLKKLYRKEEEFLDDFSDCAYAAARLLGDDWVPNSHASDDTRRTEAYFLKSGELYNLTFDSAAVYGDGNNQFLSAQIALTSSQRQVTVLVTNRGTELTATKTVDRPRQG